MKKRPLSAAQLHTLQESTARCTRCNACVQSCPAYHMRQEEAFSPRGRNQLLRLILEGKLNPAKHIHLLREVTQSCLRCSRCTAACAGAVPTPLHVRALQSMTGAHILPAGLRFGLRQYTLHPASFGRKAQWFHFLRNTGVLRLLRLTGLLFLPSFAWLRRADDILPRHARTLQSQLACQRIPLRPEQPAALYLPSFEAQYADYRLGTASLALLNTRRPRTLLGVPCGLYEYLYADAARARAQLKNLISIWEKASPRTLPLYTDGADVYSFLKFAPALFEGLPRWQKRAERLADHVRFIAELLPARAAKQTPAAPCALDASAGAFAHRQPAQSAAKILKTHFGKNFVECEYSRFVLPVSGRAFGGGATPENAVLKNVQDAARQQLRTVWCLSGWAALELDAALRRHYPAAKARHIVHLPE